MSHAALGQWRCYSRRGHARLDRPAPLVADAVEAFADKTATRSIEPSRCAAMCGT
jgi:hypothetical protein